MSGTPSRRGVRGLMAVFTRWVQPGTNPAAVVFGNVTVAAICAVASTHAQVSAQEVATAVIGTMVVYWLAHAYAEVAALRLARQDRWSWAVVREGLDGEWPLLRGASLPIVAVLLTLALGGAGAACAAAGFWTAVVALVLFEAYAARRAGEGPLGVAIGASVGLVLGLALVLLRSLVG